MWAWCGQQSDNSTATVQQYLDTLNSFEAQYPAMRFIHMTGHTDGAGRRHAVPQQQPGAQTTRRTHGKVLFDFADIESYDPAGNYYPNTDDSCPWCETGAPPIRPTARTCPIPARTRTLQLQAQGQCLLVDDGAAGRLGRRRREHAPTPTATRTTSHTVTRTPTPTPTPTATNTFIPGRTPTATPDGYGDTDHYPDPRPRSPHAFAHGHQRPGLRPGDPARHVWHGGRRVHRARRPTIPATGRTSTPASTATAASER